MPIYCHIDSTDVIENDYMLFCSKYVPFLPQRSRYDFSTATAIQDLAGFT
jgi:hypothetical protein